MLQQLQLSVSPLAQHRRREGLHNLFDGDGRTAQLILCGTDETESAYKGRMGEVISVCDKCFVVVFNAEWYVPSGMKSAFEEIGPLMVLENASTQWFIVLDWSPVHENTAIGRIGGLTIIGSSVSPLRYASSFLNFPVSRPARLASTLPYVGKNGHGAIRKVLTHTDGLQINISGSYLEYLERRKGGAR